MVLKFFGFGRSKKHSSSSKRPYPTVIEELCHPFSLADLKNATNNFDQNNVIGRGGFGEVYKGYVKLDDDDVATAIAVKRMGVSTRRRVEAFKKETELLCQLQRPNLITLIGFCINKNDSFIVYEYMSNGSLADHLFKTDGDRETLSWKKRLEICIGAARGLHYLHSGLKRTIIHRDIKPSNILLDDNMVPKLSDFGISVRGALFTEKPKPIKVEPKEDKTSHQTTDVGGTYGYMAPEFFSNGTVTDQYDVYSFGVVLFQVVSAKAIKTIMQGIIGEIMGNYREIEMSSTGSESSFSMPSYIMKETGEYQQQQPDEEIEMSNNGLESPHHSAGDSCPSYGSPTSLASMGDYYKPQLHSYIMPKLRVEDIDPALAGNIAPQCYAAYIDIIDRCLKDDPNERPTMGEVEVLLEQALTLQHQADNARDHTNITEPQQQEAPINLISS